MEVRADPTTPEGVEFLRRICQAAHGSPVEVEFERDQALSALEDAYKFIRSQGKWDEFEASL